MMNLKKNIKGNIGIKLKTQLIASFMAITFIILTISFALLYRGILDIIQTRSEQDIIKQFRQVDFSIQTFKNEVDKVSLAILVDSSIQKFLQQKNVSEIEKIEIISGTKLKVEEIIGNYDYIESIYIILENDEVIGATRNKDNYIERIDRSHRIFSTEIYKNSKERFVSLLWSGGYKSSDFNISDYGIMEDKNLLTAARALKAYYQNNQSATLIINIDEMKLSSMYNYIAGTSGNSMYLIDKRGIVISHADRTRIGSNCPWFGDIDAGTNRGSLNYKSSMTENRIIYYRMENSDWVFVNEIPVNEFIKDILTLNTIVLIIYAISLIVAFFSSLYWIQKITRPLNELTSAMKGLENGRLGLVLKKIPRNELGLLGCQFNKMSLSISELIEKNRIIEQEKRAVEMEVLQAQINPHFLFNTLNSIKWMAVVANAKNIADSLSTLGAIIQPIFKNRSIMCTLKEEIEYVTNYLTIMNYRYGKGISINFNIPEHYMECLILRFILQPIIENSFSHGMNNHIGEGEIHIEMDVNHDDIQLTVIDNGEGISEEKLKNINCELSVQTEGESVNDRGIGLVNVNRRIRLHFGKEYGISVESTLGVGTRVILSMPLTKNS